MMALVIRRFSWLERSFMFLLGLASGYFGLRGLDRDSGVPLLFVASEIAVGTAFVIVAIRGVWRERR